MISQALLFTISVIVSFSTSHNVCQPTQIHIALSESYTAVPTTESQIRAIFHTEDLCNSAHIKIRTLDGSTLTVFASEINHFSADYSDNYYETFVHIFDFPHLDYKQAYQYSCYADLMETNSQEGPFNFYIPSPIPTDDVTSVVLFGDFGTSWEGRSTLDILTEIKDNNFTSISAYIHMGDLCYDLEDRGGQEGDDYMNVIQEFAAEMPYMVTPGNHENLQNFSNFNARFRMPEFEKSQNHYYSYNLGIIHFTTISLDLVMVYPDLLDPMLIWLENDLKMANSNRDERPWVVVITHRPLYCSEDLDDCSENAKTYSQLEDLMNKYKVDLFLCGHQHAYERMLPIYQGQIAEFEHVEGDEGYHYIVNAKAPVYVVQGMAGHSGDDDKKEPFAGKEYSVVVDMEYSVMAMHALNKTHLYLENIHSKNGEKSDYMYLIKNSERNLKDLMRGFWDSVIQYLTDNM